jgi:hypothetical protein
MSRQVCKTLAHSSREPLSLDELEQTLTRVVLRPSGGLPMLSRGQKRRAVATQESRRDLVDMCAFSRIRRVVPRLLLQGVAALVTRSWDATKAPPHIGGRRTVPPDTSHTDARLGPK